MDPEQDVDEDFSESDENEEIARIMSRHTEEDDANRKLDLKRKVVIVTGEDTESDDEALVSTISSVEENLAEDAVTTTDKRKETTVKTRFAKHPTKYKSLLHKKLRERNAALQRHISDFLHQPFQNATRDVNNITQQLIKTQLNIQDLAPILRQMTNDLFHLEDKLDALQNISAVLPDIALDDHQPLAASKMARS